MIDIQAIPPLPQRQDAVLYQMADLVAVANRLGMYDASDAIRQLLPKVPTLKYGCHCDLGPGEEPDGCVIDGSLGHCRYAMGLAHKEQCKYWRIITKEDKQ